MKIIKPNSLNLLSCSISESDAVDGSVWSSSTSYSEGALVRYNHITYKSLSSGNVNNNPAQNTGGDDPAWQKIGATMPYRMLDDFVETKTVSPVGQALTFSVPFAKADSFALLNMGGYECHVNIKEQDDTVMYDETLVLTNDITALSLYEYYFSIITSDDINLKTDVPVTNNGVMTVTITPASAQDSAYIGHVIIGRNQYIGETKYSAEVGITDYSKKIQDEFGVTTFVKRSHTRNASINLFIQPFRANAIARLLTELRATPILIEGGNRDKGEEALAIYGWIEDWRCTYDGPNENELKIEINGLI